MSYRQWRVINEPKGLPVIGEDLKLEEVPIPKVEKDGQVLIKVTHFSLDPFLRGTLNKVSYGREQPYPRNFAGFASGVVEDSKNDKFQKGDIVSGFMSLGEYSLFDPETGRGITKVPPGVTPSQAVGTMGMPGATAYFGTIELLKPQEGEWLAVNAAAGAVGSLVVQIGKIYGCHVLGFAGGKEKCEWVESLGAEKCLDYKGKTAEELSAEIKAVASKGINMFFENTGGPNSEAVIENMASRGRIAVCGGIAYYNMSPEELKNQKSIPLLLTALKKQLKIEGFLVTQFGDWSPAIIKLLEWVKGDKIQIKEDIREGIENLGDNFLSLYHAGGEKSSVNFGKLILKL